MAYAYKWHFYTTLFQENGSMRCFSYRFLLFSISTYPYFSNLSSVLLILLYTRWVSSSSNGHLTRRNRVYKHFSLVRKHFRPRWARNSAYNQTDLILHGRHFSPFCPIFQRKTFILLDLLLFIKIRQIPHEPLKSASRQTRQILLRKMRE